MGGIISRMCSRKINHTLSEQESCNSMPTYVTEHNIPIRHMKICNELRYAALNGV